MFFAECYFSIFNRICEDLGSKWRIDRDEPLENNRLKIVNPELRGFCVFVNEEKGRFVISGNVSTCRGFTRKSRCTVSKDRAVHFIASDIKRKIISSAEQFLSDEMALTASAKEKEEYKELIRSALSRVVNVKKSFNCFAKISINDIDGTIYDGHNYRLELSNISADNLIKIAGFLSTL